MYEHFKIYPHSQDNLQDDCVDCKNWSIHIKKAEATILRYKEHANQDPEEGEVDKSFKKLRKVYDFPKFKRAVQEANSGKVNILEIELHDFYDGKDFSSIHKINQNHSERPYLHDMVQVQAQRGSMSLLYRKAFENSQLPLNFLNAKVTKSEIPLAKQKDKSGGITSERPDNICPIIPLCQEID
ncbi:hypothetical protein ILUMI_03069 [Ignelater luminosus]|uniref:Uncharacterized protein n=1 Tax=Ignelater luminosus TaxID=2038154 RepID=A0A8K0GKA0_IGNLU|nr:hypothetical protein ILUMI_03069 [Ignelater luminosus]